MPFFLLPVLVLWAVVALRKRLRIYQRVLSKQQLNGIVSRINNCNVSLLNDTKLSDIDRSIIKRSMVNETNGNYIDSGSPNDDHDFLNCMVEIQLLFAEMYGFVLVQHSQKSGRLLGCICIVPPYPSWWLLKGHYKRTLRCLATDAFKHSGKDSRYARYQSYIMDTMESKQKAISGFDVPDYWQIIHLSVTRQRMGCGSNLVKAAQQLIATYEEERINNIQSQRNENMRSLIMKLRNKETKTSSNSQLNIVRPIYLESDSIAVNFYQKMGFQLIGHRPIAEELQETMIMRDYDVETASAVQEGQYPILHGMLYDYNV